MMNAKIANETCNICGKTLRKIRKERRLSQEQLAAILQLEGLDFTQRIISQIETGKRVVRDYELKFFSVVLKVSVYELLGIKDE